MSSPQIDGLLIGNAPNGELNWDLFMNPNLQTIGWMLARGTLRVDLTVAPGGAAVNDRYWVASPAGAGAWSGRAGMFARLISTGPDVWNFQQPPIGMEFFNRLDNKFYLVTGAITIAAITLAPGGAASGDLTGTYPGPTVAANAITDTKVAPANKDGTVATPSMRTLGPGALQAKPGPYSLLRFPADSLDSPLVADWAVNAFAPASADTANAALVVRRFDDTIEEGAGFQAYLPAGATSLKVSFKSRAQTAPAGTRSVGVKLYYRRLQDNTAISAWSSLVLADISIPTSLLFQDDTQTILFASFAPVLVADSYYQFELTRRLPAAGTNLVGDWDLWNLMVELN